jgi:branched-chain amino acid aminotransferase
MAGSQDFAPDPRNETLLVHLDGRLVPLGEAKVSILDAGFVLGDGVWEGLRLHKSRLLFKEAHFRRLYAGARAIEIDIGRTPKELENDLWALFDANGMVDGVHVRLMVTRGLKRAPNQDPRNAVGRPTIAILAEYKLPGPHLASEGLKLFTSTIRCTPADMFDMRLNSHSRLNLVTALLQAIKAGADEALMLDPRGFVSSCNATNFFFVRDGEVLTSSGVYCFNGVTRDNVIGLCRANRIPFHLGDFTLNELYDAEEAFVTGTFGGITPVREIDGRVLPRTLPGPVTRRLRGLYEDLKDREPARHG